MDQLDAEPRAGSEQGFVHERGSVVHRDAFRDAAGGERRTQRGGQADAVLGAAPAVTNHRPAVVVHKGEEIRLPPGDLRAVQSVPDPELVGTVGLEATEDRWGLPVRAVQQIQPAEMPVDGAIRRSPAQMLGQDAYHLRGRARWVLPLQRSRQVQDLFRGPGGDLPGRWQQGVEAAHAPVT